MNNAMKKYLQTPKGKEAAKQSRINYRKSLKGKDNEWYRRSKTPQGKYHEYKKSAERRGIDFNLSKEEFTALWQKPCYYTGRAISTVGLDRVDNTKGYSIDNVVPCCKEINAMKSIMSKGEFIELIKAVVNHLHLIV